MQPTQVIPYCRCTFSLWLPRSALVFFLMWFDSKRGFNGQVALLYLVLHDGAKGLLESFRVPYVAELQVTSLSISAAGLIALIIILRYRRRTSA